MGTNGLFLAHSVQVKTEGGVDAWIDQILDASPNLGIDLFQESGSSEVDNEFIAVRARNPEMPIVTTDLSVLGTIGMSGVNVTPGSGNPGVTAWGKYAPRGSTRDAIATASHLKMVCSDGLLVPESVEGRHNEIAKLNLMLHGILGSTPTYSLDCPFKFTKDVAITSGGGGVDSLYVLAAVKFNSTLVSGVLGGAVQFGIEVFKEGSNSEIDPTFISIMSRKPRFEFSSRDGELVDDVGEAGLSCTGFTMYFQKVTQNGDRVAKATGAHISIAATEGMLTPGTLSLKHNDPGEASFTFTPSKDTNILTIATNAAIPTS